MNILSRHFTNYWAWPSLGLSLPNSAYFAKVDTTAFKSLTILLVAVKSIILPIALPPLPTETSVTFWDNASGLIYLILFPLVVSFSVSTRNPELLAKAWRSVLPSHAHVFVQTGCPLRLQASTFTQPTPLQAAEPRQQARRQNFVDRAKVLHPQISRCREETPINQYADPNRPVHRLMHTAIEME